MITNKKNVILEKDDLRGKNLPLLHKDKSWIELFGDLKNKEVVEAREKLIRLIDEERSTKKQAKQLSIDKQKHMKAILNVSYEINEEADGENLVVLDQLKDQLLKLGQELDQLDYRAELLPDEIRQANIDLLNATINSGYSQLKNREKKLVKTSQELEKSREELRKLIKKIGELQEIKEVESKWVDDTYTFMHRILGSGLIDKIDKEVF